MPSYTMVTGLNLALAFSGYLVPPFLPVQLLRITPLISSTVSLQWAVDEYQFLSSWTPEAYRAQADALLPAWFRTWGAQSTSILFGSFPWSAGAGLTNLWLLRKASWTSGAKPWYAAGVAFAFGHMLFGPKALGLLKAIREGEPDGKPTVSLKAWLRMHTIRAFVTDLPAVICFVVAVVKATKGTGLVL